MKSAADVVVALIRRHGKILITRRIPGDDFGGAWEFPGGKVRAGEGLQMGLLREIREELGVRVAVGRKHRVIVHAYPEGAIRLHGFDCRLLEGELKPLQCSQCRWVQPADLKAFRFPPASQPLVKAVMRVKGRES